MCCHSRCTLIHLIRIRCGYPSFTAPSSTHPDDAHDQRTEDDAKHYNDRHALYRIIIDIGEKRVVLAGSLTDNHRRLCQVHGWLKSGINWYWGGWNHCWVLGWRCCCTIRRRHRWMGGLICRRNSGWKE